MSQKPASEMRVHSAALIDFSTRVYQAVGIDPQAAKTAATLMIESDLAGGDGHGIFRLPQYLERIKAGGINIRPTIKVQDSGLSTAVIDGDNALGHLVMQQAADVAIEKAKKTGVGWVGVHHSNHAGAASVYASLPLKHDMVGIYIPVGNANHVPPWGGTEKLLSTNPIAIAIPALTAPPIVLDMATTVTAFGKIKVAAQQGTSMPQGWMIDREGQPLTDPKRADEGFLLPIGGYKGYGLSLMLGILAGTLNGANLGRNVVDTNKDSVTPTNTGQTMIAIDVKCFCDPTEFKRRTDDLSAEFKSSARMPHVAEIFLPGEQSYQRRQDRIAHGIPIPVSLQKALSDIAQQLKIAPLG